MEGADAWEVFQMIGEATYVDGGRRATIAIERIDTWVEAEDTILNFPGLVELNGDRLFLSAHRARHGDPDGEPLGFWSSEDAGETWICIPPDFPLLTGLIDMDFSSSSLGYLRDGTVVRIDHNTVATAERERGLERPSDPFHVRNQEAEPRFYWWHWERSGEQTEAFTFGVEGLPWEIASYQCYASILELANGDLIAALEAQPGPVQWLAETDAAGRRRYKVEFCVIIVRSRDRGRTWHVETVFDPREIGPVYGADDRAVDEGFVEADLAILPDGDILCVMRTGSYSPMFQSRSNDGGRTWSTPASTGWQGVKPRLQVLPNGLLACAAGRGAYGHPQITHAMLSLDGTGRRWECPFAFHTGPGCSYTSTMQRDGKLHVIYSHSDFTREMGTHGLRTQRIKRAVLDVRLQT